MYRYTFFFLIVLSISCTKEKEPLNAIALLNKTIESTGRQRLMHSNLTFKLNDLAYYIHRDGNSYKYIMERLHDDILYKAVASNGIFEYTENGVSKSYGSQNFQLEKQLLLMQDFMVLPIKLMNDNAITLDLLPETYTLKGVDYYQVHVVYKELMTTDLVNEYILLIHPDTFFIDYLAYTFDKNPNLFMRKAINRRDVQGISFVDYETYNHRDTTKTIKDIPKLYTSGIMKKRALFEPKIEKIIFHN